MGNFLKSLGNFVTQGAGGLLGGIFGLGQTKLQDKYNRRAAKDNYNYQKQLQEQEHLYNMEMAKYQHSQNMEMWNLQNEYNSPEQQLKRYQEAGINPHMIYGNVGSGNASTPPQFQMKPASFDGLRSVKKPTRTAYIRGWVDEFMKWQDFENTQLLKHNQSQNIQARTSNLLIDRELKQLDKLIKQQVKRIKTADASMREKELANYDSLLAQRWELNEKQYEIAYYNAEATRWKAQQDYNKANGIILNPNNPWQIFTSIANVLSNHYFGKDWQSALPNMIEKVVEYFTPKPRHFDPIPEKTIDVHFGLGLGDKARRYRFRTGSAIPFSKFGRSVR